MAQANVVNTLIIPAESTVSPYYDDFNESKNFHRIMFRPGYAVQARELTQLQSILQNQVERFGRHIFINGSSVIGGKIDITDSYTLNISPTYANTDININLFKDKTITRKDSSGSNYASARVVQVSEASNTAPAALHIKYITGAEFNPGDTIQVDGTSVFANLAPTSNAVTQSTLTFIYDSIYFMNGYFIKVPEQVIVLSKHNRSANAKVGLALTEAFITEASDTSLLDPALESSNYQAPGAARYRVELVLDKRSLDSVDDEKFIQIARVEEGVIKELVKNPIYSEIEEVFARRTYDESGNYTTKPFKIRIENSKIDPTNNYTIVVSPGKAYLYGYEIENQSETKIEIPAARTTSTTSNYGLNTTYGNYVIVDNLTGRFNTTSLAPVDMHCVSANQVNYANTATYNSTKAGSARVRDINFYGGDVDVTARKFEFYFFDQKFRTVTGNVTALSTNAHSVTINTANASSANDAYVGAFIKILTGNAAGDLRIVTEYNGTTKTANVNPSFSTYPEANAKFEIRFDMTDVDSFIANTTYTANATVLATATVSAVSKDDQLMTGNTIVSDTGLINSFWPYPERYIAPGISEQTYLYRKIYNSVNFSAGNSTPITAGTDEEFAGSTTTSNTDLSVMSNFLVVVTDATGSGRSVGEQIKVSSTITTSTPEQATLYTGNTTESFVATVYAKVRAAGDSAQHRVKTLVLGNNSVLTTSSPSGQFTSASGSNTKVYLATGQVVIKDFSPNTAQSLYISDVLGTKGIYGTNTVPTGGLDLTTLDEISDKFLLEIGQTRTHYDHATLRLKPGYILNYKYVIVVLRYYSTTSDVGYFSVDSYPHLANTIYDDGVALGTGYSIIPIVDNIRLADCIDFRPVRPNLSTGDLYVFNTSKIPISGEDFTSNFNQYLERRDIITLSLNDSINLIKGNPSKTPNFPATPYRNLLLSKIRVLPYTVANNSVLIKNYDYRRYTMEDISVLDKRLSVVEYTMSLNALEKQATDIVIPDVNGLDRTKYGILAENFTTFLLSDTTSPDFSCAIDTGGTFTTQPGAMMPRPFVGQVKLKANSSSGISKHNERFTLSYTTESFISQNVASKILPVTNYLFSDFRGQMVTVPDADIWKYDPPPPPPPPRVDPTPYNPAIGPGVSSGGYYGGGYGGGSGYNPGVTEYDVRVIYNENAPNGGAGSIYYNKTTGEWVSNYGPNGPAVPGDQYNLPTAGMSYGQFTNLVRDMAVNSGRIVASQERFVTNSLIEDWVDTYRTTFNRDPDLPGLTYWVTESAAKGAPTVQSSGLYQTFISGNEAARNVTTNAVPSNLITYGNGGFNASAITTQYVQQSGTGPAGLYAHPALYRGQPYAAGSSATTYDTTTSSSYSSGSESSSSGYSSYSAPTSQQIVSSLYSTVLDRAPDSGGLAYWSSQLDSGMSTSAITSAMMNSAEYKDKYGI